MALQVVVIGAGIVGSSVAWRLAQRGCGVTLVDAGAMGGEASWAAAGMLAPGAEVAEASSWSAMALASARAYPEFVRELVAESGCAIDYQKGGAVEIAAGAEEQAELRERVQRQAALGIVSERLDRSGLWKLAPGATLPEDDAEARYFPADAIVDPRDIMKALRAACTRLGVRIVENSPVREVRWRDGGVVAGEWEADAAVLAAGAWASDVKTVDDGSAAAGMVLTKPESFPVRGHLLGYSTLAPGLLTPILRRGHTYLLQRASGFFIAGASAERVGFDRTIDPAIVAELRTNAERLYSPLRGLQPEPWVGFRPATPRLAPEIDPLPGTAIWLAYGHYRNGILLAPATAERVASGLVGG